MKRNRPDAHKRRMLLATANTIIPALARLVTQTTDGAVPGVVGAVVLVDSRSVSARPGKPSPGR